MRSFRSALALAGVFVLLAGFGQEQQTQTTPKDVNVSFLEVGNVWKAVLTGTTETSIHVVVGQKVIFHSDSTDVYIQFDNDQLFGGHYRTIKKGGKLTLGVGNVAKGVYVYAAFCSGPKVFAQGGSPPKIIVD